MTGLQAFLLGILQGITEFLPVSSSGHLELAQYFLGLENLNQYVTFDLVCHLGTLLAIVAVYSESVKRLFSTDRVRLRQIFLGTLPLFPMVAILKPLEALYDRPELLGMFFLVTAVLLFAGIRWGREKSEPQRKRHLWRDALFIGIVQSFALLPGVSRSGSTISAARLLGWGNQDAVQFSLLLAIPAILGGCGLKILQLTLFASRDLSNLPLSVYLTGFASSFFFGYFSLLLLIRLASKGKFLYFVWYCLLLGGAVSFYFHIF